MKFNLSKFFVSIFLCLGVGFLGSIFTVSSIPTWYVALNKPFFSPPNWVFAPVWTMLYLLMGFSLYLVWSKEKAPFTFFVQLILNFLWSIIFFGLKMPGLAVIEILFLWSAIFLTIRNFWKINKTAGVLLLPYIFWVSFASILNLSVYILNR